MSLVMAGVTASGNIEIWWFESPDFVSHRLATGYKVVGSGAEVSSYIQSHYEEFDRDLPTLKSRADALLMGLEAELQRLGVDTVGGLLQLILLEAGGIRPLSYGFMNLDPEAAAEAKSIGAKAGRWVQRDVARGLEFPLVEPAALLRNSPAEVRVQDFHLPSEESRRPKWHLAYFLTCFEVRRDVGTIEFRGVMSGIASPDYPFSVNILAVVGFWGSPGDHEVNFILEQEGKRQQVHNTMIHMEYLPEDLELAIDIPLNILAPGPAFLEVRIGDQILGRRALYFGQVADTPPSSESELAELARRQGEALTEQQRACRDPSLDGTGESVLVYLSLCQNCRDEGMLLRFEGQIMAVFWKSYPLPLSVFIASAFRMPKGEHRLRVELVNAASRKASSITAATVISNSSCIVTPVHGELVILVPEPGIYFVNIYIDDRLVSTALFAAETDQPQYSYVPAPTDAARVTAGELLILQKRTPQARRAAADSADAG